MNITAEQEGLSDFLQKQKTSWFDDIEKELDDKRDKQRPYNNKPVPRAV